MRVPDGVHIHKSALRPAPPRVDRPRSAPTTVDGVPVAAAGQKLFRPHVPRAPASASPPPSPPPVPTSLAEARQRVYDEAIEAATPAKLHRLPPEDRADVLSYAAQRADEAIVLFDDLHEAANPLSPRDLRQLPPDEAREVRQQALEGAWQAYQVLAADGLPVRPPSRGSAVIEHALAQTEALLASAASLTPELREACLTRILAGTDGLESLLTGEIDRSLADRFPTLEALYGEQSRRFAEALREGIGDAAEAALGPAPTENDPLWSLERLRARYEAMRGDVAILARFSDAEAGLDAFGITLGHDEGVADWSDEQREQALGQAIRVENAFRAADREGLLAREVDGALRQYPYQQNTTASNGEYFADVFANWANGTLLDNEAGRALGDWMNRMAPEWIRTRLEASDLLEPPPDATDSAGPGDSAGPS